MYEDECMENIWDWRKSYTNTTREEDDPDVCQTDRNQFKMEKNH